MEREVIQGLIERGVPIHVALGMAGNMSVESMFQPGINEINPVVPGSRGGFGLNQWTGPRRKQFEDFARQQGKPLDDLDAQLDFTLWELGNTEAGAAAKLYATSTPEEAATVYSNAFLRPGVPHMDRRLSETNRLASMVWDQQQQQPQQQRNALMPPQAGYLDPSAFMNRGRA